MTAILGTLPFLATLWLLVVLGAAILEESGGKIGAALRGQPAQNPVWSDCPVRHRSRAATLQPKSAPERLRAAA